MRTLMRTAHVLAMTLVLSVATVGCDQGDTASTPQTTAPQATAPKPATQPLIPVAAALDWCKEHGVPESVCAQCNESLVAGFKTKGDWCEEHSVPKSQDFAHHPELKQKFAAAYKEKYGKEPPAGEDHDHDQK